MRRASQSNSPTPKRKKKKKSKSLMYWESLSAEEIEEQFNYWNRRQTTGLTIEELTPRTSVHDNDNMLLIVIDLSIDRDKVSLMKAGKRRKSLEKLLKKLP